MELLSFSLPWRYRQISEEIYYFVRTSPFLMFISSTTGQIHDSQLKVSSNSCVHCVCVRTLGDFLCIPTPNPGQLNPLFHTFVEFRLIVNRIIARQSTDWLGANAQFSPIWVFHDRRFCQIIWQIFTHGRAKKIHQKWGLKPGSPDLQANALPTELSQHSVASMNLHGLYKVMLYWF